MFVAFSRMSTGREKPRHGERFKGPESTNVVSKSKLSDQKTSFPTLTIVFVFYGPAHAKNCYGLLRGFLIYDAQTQREKNGAN